MSDTIKVLQLEDVATDAELCLRELKRAGMRCEGKRVDTEPEFLQQLAEYQPDIILSDFSMPHFDGMQALAIAARSHPDTPFLFVSGTLGEEYAVRALQNGATDYVLKTNLIRLPAAVSRAITEARKNRERQKLHQRLQESEAGLSRAQSLAKLAHIVTGRDGSFETWSDTLPSLLGLQHGQVPRSTRAWLEMLHPEDRAYFRDKCIEAAKTGERVDVGYRLRHASGDWLHVEQVIEPLAQVRRHPDAAQQWFCTLQDVTDKKRSEDKIRRLNRVHLVLSGVNSAIVRIRERRELFRETCRVITERGNFSVGWIALLDRASEKLVPVAHSGLPRDFSEQFSDSGGFVPWGVSEIALRERRAALDNDIARDPQPGETPAEQTAKDVRRAAIRMGARSVIVLPLFVNGDILGVLTLYAPERHFFDADEIKLLSDLAGDISFALEALEKEDKLNYLAYYDPLTGLANRALLHDRLTQYVNATSASSRRVAAILLNLDRFSHLNEILGRQAADDLLRLVATRLDGILGEPVSLARVGGDNFAFAVADLRQEDDIVGMLDAIFSALSRPFDLEAKELRVSAKAGIAVCPGDGRDAETLLRNAEVALKRAKSRGDPYLFYAPEMNARVAEKVTLENQLRQAIEREQFVLHYQPKVRLADGSICGLEALIRWSHPDMGLVPPARFIPLLEETGLILQVGAWALRRAVSDYHLLSHAGRLAPRIAVNVSPLQLRQKGFADAIANALGYNADPSQVLDLEITESVIMENIESNIDRLAAVRQMGVNIAVDDFGTGYSSLAYISRLPVNTLKVDRSFVQAMEHSTEDANIVSTIIALAHSLKLKVVAEGVETEAQRARLRELLCDEMQGYLFSKPVTIDKIEAMLSGK